MSEIIEEMARVLCMSEESTINFLEQVAEVKDKINELTSWTQTEETYKSLCACYCELDKLVSPICPDCHVRVERFITSPARLYDPEMAELPGGTTMRWTGEWYCPKCRHPIAFGNRWWDTKEERGKAKRDIN